MALSGWSSEMMIRWLEQGNSADVAQVGGKAAHLSRLASRYNVPAGFIVPVAAFEDWPGRNGHELPKLLRNEVAAAYRRLSEQSGILETSVAVRSSAVDEDGVGVSFAGVHVTFLNVFGLQALTEAIRRCWESATSEHALAYRRQHGLSAEPVRMAVLVQQLIVADVSAVVFSANPATGSRDELVINANWGLGESIVGGTATPDAYTVRRAGLLIAEQHVGRKERMTVLSAAGVQQVAVPQLLRHRLCLAEPQVMALARLAVELEQIMGWPVDLECAIAGEVLYLLQCRPIPARAVVAPSRGSPAHEDNTPS